MTIKEFAARGVGCSARRLWTVGFFYFVSTGVQEGERGKYVERKGMCRDWWKDTRTLFWLIYPPVSTVS